MFSCLEKTYGSWYVSDRAQNKARKHTLKIRQIYNKMYAETEKKKERADCEHFVKS